ncbi:MAG: hypothetical protein WBC44_21740 [Planctomycetaceae bacterium]
MNEQDGYKFEPVRFLMWLPAYVLVAFTLYVLSAGPMYWLIYSAYFLDPNPLLAILYLPLVWLSGQSDLCAQWLDWYVGLWVL